MITKLSSLEALTKARNAARDGKHIVRVPVSDAETTTAAAGFIELWVMPSGSAEPVTRVSGERVFIVLEGEPETLDGSGIAESRPARQSAFVPAGSAFGIRNTGNDDALVYVIHMGAASRVDVTSVPESDDRPDGAVTYVSVPEPIPTFTTLNPEPLFKVGNYHLANEKLTESHTVYAGVARFEPGGRHTSHRHLRAPEILFFLRGAAVVVTETDEIPMSSGDYVFIPPGDWHAVHSNDDSETELIYTYLGVASREAAGVELPPGTAGSDA